MAPESCCGHRYLREHARGIAGKSQLFINAYAKALEVIPRQLCDNSGLDATDVLNVLRQKHALKDGSGSNFGVDVSSGQPQTTQLVSHSSEAGTWIAASGSARNIHLYSCPVVQDTCIL